MSRELYKLNIGFGFALFGIIALTAVVIFVSAASLANRKDQMSNQTKNGLSAHQISFNLSSGNTFSNGEQIAVDFPAQFATGGTWTTSDFTFTDGTARTVNAVAQGAGITTVSCTNAANNIGVAIDTTALVFRAIPCGAAFTPSAATAFVTFLIDGTISNGTLANPATAGSYVINILSAGGDCASASDNCSMAVAVVDDGNVVVSATVPGAVCGNGIIETPEACDDGNVTPGDGCSATCTVEGGGGGPPPDTTPPVITNVRAENITNNSANIRWDTNEASNSLVRYGLTASYGNTTSDGGFVAAHTVAISSLAEATLYHYQVCSTDSASNQGCSGDNTFTTLDETPPVISGVLVTTITATSASVTWNTNEFSTSNVDYGLTVAYGSTTTNPALVTGHTINLTGLTPSTTYHYRVRSADASSNESFTSDATFTTLAPADTTPPVITSVAVSSITSNAATVTWTTNEPATSFVDYGTSAGPSYPNTVGNAALVTSHTVNLTGLASETTFHYSVRSADAASNSASTADATFTTLDGTAPIITSVAVSAITSNSATVSWTTNEPATSFVDYGVSNSYGSTSGNATLVTSHTVNLTGLAGGTTYHYRVRSADATGNSAASNDATFLTLTGDTTPPVISSVAASGITQTAATVTWTTNEPATSFVDYGVSNSYGSTSGNATLVTSHTVNLSGLSAGTTYHYRVRSADAASNSATSSDATFTTQAAADVTPPVISNIQISNLTATGVTVTWDTNEPATSFVDHGLTVAYGSTSGNATLVTSHTVNISGLTQDTTYHYRVRSADASSNSASSGDATFHTISSVAPAITNVQVTSITATGATVTWDTNETTTSFVDYGTTVSYGTTAGNGAFVTSHAVNLTGLSENTTYHFSVRSADVDSNSTSTSDDTFKTLDVTPPVISGITATNITKNAARIGWTTNESADSVVEYGLTVAYGSTQSNPAAVTTHQIDLTGLAPDTTYHFRVKSKDGSNNLATSGDNTFKTLKPPPPVISNIQVTAITQTTATVSWTTDVASDSVVDYGLTNAYGTTRADLTAVTSHSINLTGLIKNRTYHFMVSSTDAYAQTSSASDQTFNTAVDVAPPGPVAGFIAAPGNQTVSLTWTNPSDPDFQGMLIVRKLGSFPTGPGDGTQIYDSTGTAYDDVGLTNGVTYFYTAFSHDDVPNYAVGGNASATPSGPPDSTPPPDVSSFTAVPGDARIQLNWTNPSDPDFVAVRVMRKTTGFPANANDGTVAYDGNGTAHLDTGLTNDVLYYYTAFSYDGALNHSAGVQASGTPQAPPDNTAPGNVTNFVATAGDSQIQLTWTNPPDPDWIGTRILRKTGGVPTGPNDGTIVFDGITDNKLDTGLTNGVTYHYGAFAYDAFPNFASGTFVQATPTQGAPPPPPPSCSDSDGGKNYDVQGTVLVGASNYTDICSDSSHVIENFCAAGTQDSEVHDCGTGFKCSAGRCVSENFQPTGTVCGNGICEQSENSSNCSQDCPVPPSQPPAPETPPTVAAEEHLEVSDFMFFATSANIRLRLTPSDQIAVYKSMTVRVYLPDQSIIKPIATAHINFAGASYPMRQTASFEGTVSTPPVSAQPYPMTIQVDYQDGTHDSVSLTFAVVPHGDVYENLNGHDTPVSGARVTLLVDNGNGSYGVWSGSTFGQSNPRVTLDDGSYAFIVPPGSYKLRAEKDGYLTKETLSFPITTQNVITNRLLLIHIPPPPVAAIQDILKNNDSVGDKAGAIAGVIGQQLGFIGGVTGEQISEVKNNPIVQQQTEQIAVPAAIVVGVANVATAGAVTASAIPYAIYIYSLLAHPLLLIARRRRKKWGIVYNSLSKLPVDLVIVRLLDAATGRILRSAVTDKDGRYFFIIQKGQYKLVAAKAGFIFPSALLKSQKEDINYLDLYHGEMVDVKVETAITANIPLDPLTIEKTPKIIMWEGIARRFQKSIGIVSIVAMGIAAYISPKPFIIALFVANLVFYAVFKRLSVTKKPKNWGIVYDETSGKPVQNAVARIFEAKFNKLLETQVTDIRGRYSFLVGNNVYYVTFEKPGYQKQQKGPVDLLAKPKEGEKVVAIDVKLKKSDGTPVASPPAPPAAPQTPLPPAPPAPPDPSTTPPVSTPPPPPPAPAPAPPPVAAKIPWELQILQQGKAQKPSSPPEQKAKAEEPVIKVMPLIAGMTQATRSEDKDKDKKESEIKLIQDADHAHPDEKKDLTTLPTQPSSTSQEPNKQ